MSAKNYNTQVLTADIAKVLTVDQKISKREFSELTGISFHACSSRLIALIDLGGMKREGHGSSKVIKFWMTAKGKEIMLQKTIDNKAAHGKNRWQKKKSEEKIAAEKELQKFAYNQLKAVKFI